MSEVKEPPVVLRWSRHPRQVGRARAALRAALAAWGLSSVQDSAELVLSELLTNAGRHARVSPGREIETRFIPVGGGVRIEVHDASEAPPVTRRAAPESTDGRGLFIVSALARSWGIGERNGPGKFVWAHVVAEGASRAR
ncbi:ATP-binding protein [Streptomyces sp. NBC_00654]|uniref:ATP-binding protein n=1 Tax=Streptomyces sp. NBC_00654 TaxID=2975799 RepID=UPI00224E1F5B|nr:ATP-binding protein [Streptomyces sp. NBC_00654]MCX4964154.1 ATP-binding protein [Streptomyces sp. NBC_00654]